ESELVEKVRALLGPKIDIATTSSAAHTRVRVEGGDAERDRGSEHAAHGVRVTVEDPTGRISTRAASDPQVAAWLIESMTRDDLDADLLSPREIPGVGAGAGEGEVAARTDGHPVRTPIIPIDQMSIGTEPPVATHDLRLLEIGADFESSIGGDRSL